MARPSGKWLNMAILCASVVGALCVWFAATAAVPQLIAAGLLTSERAGQMTAAVQLGFVAGTLASALLLIADRFPPRALFAASAILAAGATAALVLVEPAGTGALMLRFIAGLAMAGVYPVGMKLASGWADRDLGLLIGLLVGALTLGSAAPHLVPRAVGTLPWQTVYLVAGALCLTGGALIMAFREGPKRTTRPRFRLSDALEAWRNPALRLANLGYLGHMWELYAMWAWIGVFFHHWGTLRGPGFPAPDIGLIVFGIIAAGAPGAVLAGLAADRFGRARVAAGAMAISGTMALLIGPAAQVSLALAVVVGLVWGFAVVADSAQFSACVVEHAEPDLVGTMLTVQNCLGFLLTVVAIQAVPAVLPDLGWRGAFATLAIGPALGILAMIRLDALSRAPRPVAAGGQAALTPDRKLSTSRPSSSE